MVRYKKGPSWAVIIISLIIFWPVGVFFLVKRLTTDREEAVKKNGKAPVMGWILFFVGLFFFSSYLGRIFQGDRTLLFAAFFLSGGLIALSTATKKNQAGEKYRRYIDAVVNHGLVSIQDIAAFAQVQENRAKKDLKKMIRMGYFQHALIDERRGEIYLHQRQGHETRRETGYSPGPASGNPPYQDGSGTPYGAPDNQSPAEIMATCRNCGAHNWIWPGRKNDCEFCGSPINGL